MKRLTTLCLMLVLALVLAACGNDEDKSDNSSSADTEEAQKQQEEAQKQMEEMQKKFEKQQVDADKTVAIVNETEIKGKEYNALLTQAQQQSQAGGADPTTDDAAKELQDQVLKSLVGNELLLQAAKNNDYEVSDKEINEELQSTKDQLGSEEKFAEALKATGSTEEEYKQQLKEGMLVTKYVENELSPKEVTEDDMKSYYEKMEEQAKESKQGDSLPKYEEVKEQLKASMEQQNLQAVMLDKVDELEKDADVEYKI
ncbi:SurA N-terminal domain-containing protein [Terribacillus aidingensis]|uniref:peptidylprolyl isomerase n=1 Tax=Terribacillus aidingensis TaxID=586416 RepID=A0A285N9A5_9BACI|nr:SurA N-terminal domain-containing protein [Terribacillus aidingensis]SNZ06000.1 SurA N-terminal domain-containing protein [Terribacillus aidingensis]